MACAARLFLSELCGLLSIFCSERMGIITDIAARLRKIYAIVKHIEKAVGNSLGLIGESHFQQVTTGTQNPVKRPQ
jgi:hypothetical protein